MRIGGHDVRDLTLESLRSVVGVVPQDAYLFHDTIRANLLYARPSATEKELIEACQAARIWELISSLPDGLDTIAGDRGYRFSGGEKQRIALARLLLKAPSVVVLDEATAHLDSESEAAIQRALATALAGRTSLVLAHRLSTVRAAPDPCRRRRADRRKRGTAQRAARRWRGVRGTVPDAVRAAGSVTVIHVAGKTSVRRGGIWAGAGGLHLLMLTQKSFVRLGRPAYHGCMTFWSAKERDGYMNPSSQLKAALSTRTAAV